VTPAPQVPLAVHPFGVFLAATFALTMGSLLWWMLHPPAPVEQVVAHARHSVSALRRILVPVHGSTHNSRAVELACRLGEDQKAEIVLGAVIEVPMAMPLATPLENEEKQCREDLETAADIVRLHGLSPIPVLERDRDIGRGLIRIARGHDADLVVVGVNPHRLLAGDPIGRTTETLLRKAGIEVIVDMAPVV
jgi:nucleotide-binding universal stress UspA family protein